MTLHKSLGVGDIHVVYNWSYANATAREAAEGFYAADIGKVAIQLDDFSFWVVAAVNPAVPYMPTWVQMGDPLEGSLVPSTHQALRQLIHFIDNGPTKGFASGAYREITGTAFPTAVTWYDKAGAGKKKIVEKLITYVGPLPDTITWKIYDASEVLLETVVDTISYSDVFETSRTRTIS